MPSNAQAALAAALHTGYTETTQFGDGSNLPRTVKKVFDPKNVEAHAEHFLRWLDKQDGLQEERASLEQRVGRLERQLDPEEPNRA